MQTLQAKILGAGIADEFLSDERVGETWYLKGSGKSDVKVDVASVWEDYTGEGVKVGVIDSDRLYARGSGSLRHQPGLQFRA